MTIEDSLRDKEPRGSGAIYRKAILKALESLHDFQTRSNIDAVRRHTQALLEDQHTWNDTLFLKTMKSVIRKGEVDLCANISAELSPDYKRKRADSLLQKIEEERQMFSEAPELPLGYHHHYQQHPQHHHHHHQHHHSSPFIGPQLPSPTHQYCHLKDAPHRRPEHEKWKIIPKKLYDKTLVINPMDTN